MTRAAVFAAILSLAAPMAMPLSAAPAQTESPVAAVIAFGAIGLPRSQADALTDLFSYNLTREDLFIVAGRQESGRIVDSLDMPPMDRTADGYFFYIGDFLYADVLFSGSVRKEGGELSWRVTAYAPAAKVKLTQAETRAADMAGLYRACPGLLRELLASVPARFDQGLVMKYKTALSPFTVKQRVLFVLPEGSLDAETALAREMLSALFTGALKSDDFLPLYYERAWQAEGDPPFPASALAKRFDAHRVFYVAGGAGERIVRVADEAGAEIATFKPGILKADDAEAALAALKRGLPPLPQDIVARELIAINRTNGKMADILSERRVLAKPFALSLSQKMVKTVGHPSFQPTFSFFAADAAFLWYYGRLVGTGAGYGVSVSYPGTLDARIAGHPLFIQHELRLYPLALRMPGKSGFLANGFLSLNAHNASRIIFHLAGDTTYAESRQIYYARVGADLGYFINLSEGTAITLNALSLAYCIPIRMGPNFQEDRSFSGDIGGVGILIRF